MKLMTRFNPTAEEIDFLTSNLMAYNQNRIDGYAYENFILKQVDEAGLITAGLHGQIGGDWLYIAGLWVDEAFRKQGIGRALVAGAEKIAVQKNCVGIYLYTYTFQNPGFYKSLGFQAFGELDRFWGENSKTYMKKEL